ncbi:MAG: hypothetical protein WCG31_08325 [Deltaproteobacteria bacterium]
MLAACYSLVVIALADYMRNKPFLERLGYIPSVNTLKVFAADHKQLLSASLMLKVQIYFGGLIEKAENKLQVPADYPAMSRTIDAALKLDPYNMDGYYFAQAILAWDVGKPDLANTFLEYGMKYRTWDWQLPFFAGFNYAYFLKDYGKAAREYQRAAELSGNEMFINLAGRYMQRSGKTEMAITYLGMMAKSARQLSMKRTLLTRQTAFLQVLKIEKARDTFFQHYAKLPTSLDDLVHAGYLPVLPRDPYGGTFFIKNDGSIDSTSGFAFAAVKK